MIKFKIIGGKNDGKYFEAEFKENNKLYKRKVITKQDVAADGSVMTSKMFSDELELVFVAGRDEKIVESE